MMVYCEYAEEYATLVREISADEGVREVVCAEVDGTLIVAVITNPVFFKSEGEKLMRRIKIKAEVFGGGQQVQVTSDADIFYMVKYGGERGQRRAYETLTARQN